MTQGSPQGLSDGMIVAVIVGIVLFVGVFAASVVVEEGRQITYENGSTTDAINLENRDSAQLDYYTATNQQVYDSLGNSIELSGSSDSYFQSQDNVDFNTTGEFTLSTWVYADSSISGERTVASLNGRLVQTYNSTTGNWEVWYYDERTTDSYELEANATSPGSFENVQVVSDGNSIELYVSSTSTPDDTVQLDGGFVESPNASNWDGRIDEVRTFDTALNATQRQSLRNDPVGPLPDSTTARIMFDERGTSTQLLFYASGGVDTFNANIVDGLNGSLLTEGTDYSWDSSSPGIEVLSGGRLDGAPVAYASFDYSIRQRGNDMLMTFEDSYNGAMGLAALLIVLIPLGAIFTYLYATKNRGGRR